MKLADSKRAMRLAQGRCGQCGGKRPDDNDGRTTCQTCLDKQRSRYEARKAGGNPHGRIEQVISTCQTMTSKEQAKAYGMQLSYVRQIRTAARKEGIEIPYETRGKGGQESKAWAALDHATERCVCGLLLPCDSCIPRSAAELAENRSGAGRTYPSGGGI